MEDLIAIRMRLFGGKEAAAEAEAVNATIAETGAVAEKASAQQVEASKAATAATAAQTAAYKKQRDTVAGLGRGLNKWVTTPLLAIGAASIYLNAKFSRAMLQLHTQAGVAKKELGGLRKSFQAISKETGFSPQEVVGAGYRLAGAGLRGKKLKQATRSSALLAMVGDANPEDTAKTLSQIWFTNIKGGKDFNRVIGEINATVGAGDLRLPQLVDALGTGVVASAKQAGLTLQDVNGAMAVFGDETNNVSGWSAQLATALHFITNPTEKAEGALHSLGLSSTKLSKDFHQPHGLATALGELKDKLKALPGGEEGVAANRAIGDILPGGRGRVLLVLINQLERLEQKEKQIHKTQRQFGRSVKETMEQPAVKLKKAWQQVENTLIELGAALTPVVIPALEKGAQVVGSVARWFNGLSTGMKKTIGMAVALVAALGPLISIGLKLEKLAIGAKIATGLGTPGAASGKLGARMGLGGLIAGGGTLAAQAGGNAIGGKFGQWVSDVGTGASVGAGVGMTVGGPFGALVGGGIGAGAGAAVNIYRNLTGQAKHLSFAQIQLGRDSKVVAKGMKEQRAAGNALIHSENRVQTATARTRNSSRGVTKARHALNAAVRRYGTDSLGAIQAEVHLGEAINHHRQALKRLHNAEKLRGVELSEYKTIARTNVLNERNEINVLQRKAAHLNNEYTALKKSGAGQGELTAKAEAAQRVNGRLNTATGKLNTTMLESSRKAGPAFNTFLHNATRELLEAGSAIGALNAQVEGFGELAEAGAAANGGKKTPLGKALGTKGNHPSAKSTEHGLEGLTNRRRRGPVDRWRHSPDSAPTEYTAPSRRGDDRGGGGKYLAPIVIKVGRRTLANVMAETKQDDEARL